MSSLVIALMRHFAVSELLQNLQFFMATDINKIAKNIKQLVWMGN
jgi:hypothetical protein